LHRCATTFSYNTRFRNPLFTPLFPSPARLFVQSLSHSLFLLKARKLIPLSWDRPRYTFLLLLLCVSHSYTLRLHLVASLSAVYTRSKPLSASHNTTHHIDASSVTPRLGGRLRTSSILSQRCSQLKGRTVVNADLEAHKPHQASAQ
jgi:hypothetical protein